MCKFLHISQTSLISWETYWQRGTSRRVKAHSGNFYRQLKQNMGDCWNEGSIRFILRWAWSFSYAASIRTGSQWKYNIIWKYIYCILNTYSGSIHETCFKVLHHQLLIREKWCHISKIKTSSPTPRERNCDWTLRSLSLAKKNKKRT